MAERRGGKERASAGARSRGRSASGRRFLAAAATLVAAVVVVVWWIRRPATVATGAVRGCNLQLITIDTLRSDRVGAFGGPPGLTPNLDRLAADGIRFTRAYASAPLTLPSHTSILTSVSPPVHGVRTNGLFRLGPALPTLLLTVRRSALAPQLPACTRCRSMARPW